MNVHKTEPVLTAAFIAGAIVALASTFHIVLALGTVTTVVTAVLPIIAALWARSKVTPVP